MIKNTLYIITFFVLSLFVTSCCNEKTIKIKNKDKLKFNENDIFIYKSNLNNYDTLFIKEINSEFKYRYKAENFCHNDVYKERIRYYYDNYKEPFHKDSLLFLGQSYDQYTEKMYFSMDISYKHNEDSFYIYDDWRYAKYKYGVTYIGICFLEDSIYENVKRRIYSDTTLKNGPYKFLYNKKYGFLSYEYRTGEKFDLYKYIPKN